MFNSLIINILNMDNIRQRIFEIVSDFANVKYFCNCIGFNYQTYKAFESREGQMPSLELVAKIMRHYPNLNYAWA
jgi:hypothetical protein